MKPYVCKFWVERNQKFSAFKTYFAGFFPERLWCLHFLCYHRTWDSHVSKSIQATVRTVNTADCRDETPPSAGTRHH